MSDSGRGLDCRSFRHRSRCLTEWKTPLRTCFSVRVLNKRSTRFGQDALLGVGCSKTRSCRSIQSNHIGVFVGRVVVQDNVDLQRVRPGLQPDHFAPQRRRRLRGKVATGIGPQIRPYPVESGLHRPAGPAQRSRSSPTLAGSQVRTIWTVASMLSSTQNPPSLAIAGLSSSSITSITGML